MFLFSINMNGKDKVCLSPCRGEHLGKKQKISDERNNSESKGVDFLR